jgi:hypothetical protein
MTATSTEHHAPPLRAPDAASRGFPTIEGTGVLLL